MIAGFRTSITGVAVTPDVQGIRQQLADAHKQIRQHQASQATLEAKIKTLCAVIAELIHETTANNVLAMPSRRHRDA